MNFPYNIREVPGHTARLLVRFHMRKPWIILNTNCKITIRLNYTSLWMLFKGPKELKVEIFSLVKPSSPIWILAVIMPLKRAKEATPRPYDPGTSLIIMREFVETFHQTQMIHFSKWEWTYESSELINPIAIEMNLLFEDVHSLFAAVKSGSINCNHASPAIILGIYRLQLLAIELDDAFLGTSNHSVGALTRDQQYIPRITNDMDITAGVSPWKLSVPTLHISRFSPDSSIEVKPKSSKLHKLKNSVRSAICL